MIRIQIEYADDKLKQLEALMAETGARTKKELISNALTLLAWAVREKKAGYSIASVDKSRRYREVLLAALENVTVEENASALTVGSFSLDDQE